MSQSAEQVPLITLILVSVQSLNPIQADHQVGGQPNLFQINRDDILCFVKSEVDFPITVIRFERTRICIKPV